MASDHAYHPKDTIGRTIKSTAWLAGAGTFVSAIQNTLTKQNYGPMGIFRQTGGTIATFTAMGFSYEFVRCATANLRQKDDTWNEIIGGFFGGAMVGLRVRTVPAFLGYGAGLATILGTFDFCGHALTGYTRDPNVDEYERKEYLRTNRRRPFEQTVAELGEGRGIRGPGYEERRRQLLKEKYGYEITAPSAH
ncbi:uncharacterized protein K452DRAFT_284769 [Aplosporella prunicola CBS 121167]|uniref:NADH-ubiquinone oxidoreductase 213 kDa subunit n=1 Tax=Aplosporella prunicola CBS 121167 TaxID=1176127 RepID=A0A6A6BJY4_9PEZI|nr:uncharacterized protein K452DRAFT_284769 [Aplosporella prunicola CBS 121167]KAF2144450.1 hypothetical protein K452DRAFT_284769 [Aplosporella prunicola CBS 121167]